MRPKDEIRDGIRDEASGEPDGLARLSVRQKICLIAGAVLLVDFITKQIMLGWIFYPPLRVEVLPFLNFVPVWNPGISFGMLTTDGMLVPVLLTVLAIAVAVWLIWKAPRFHRFERMGAGLIAGGAVGNALDRIRFGKVVDFIDVFVQTWGLHWPAFNIADAAITIGALLWFYSILAERETEAS